MPYKTDFIDGFSIKLPNILHHQDIAPLLHGHGHVINYHHHSVAMNKKRKQAFYSASNIDGSTWVELIQEVTKLDFDLAGVRLPFKTETPREIVYKRIEVERKKERKAWKILYKNLSILN